MKKYDNSHATSPYMSWQVNEGTWVWMDCGPITSQLAGIHPLSVIDKIFCTTEARGAARPHGSQAAVSGGCNLVGRLMALQDEAIATQRCAVEPQAATGGGSRFLSTQQQPRAAPMARQVPESDLQPAASNLEASERLPEAADGSDSDGLRMLRLRPEEGEALQCHLFLDPQGWRHPSIPCAFADLPDFKTGPILCNEYE